METEREERTHRVVVHHSTPAAATAPHVESGTETEPKRPKVFGIGFHKTGTKSLGTALTSLGYRVTGPFGVHDPDIASTARQRAFEIAGRFDAFQDNPWPILYRDLEERFPTARFVLTIRDTDQWLASVVSHFGGQSTPMREWIYGVGDPRGAEDVFRERYERHNREVMEHFGSSDALLVMRIAEGDGWQPLCRFLGAERPDEPFPHANSRSRRRPITRAMRKLRRRIGAD